MLGSGLLWAAGSREEAGISGWKTLNVSMEQAIGNTDSETKAKKTEQESLPAVSRAEVGGIAAVKPAESAVSTGQPVAAGASGTVSTVVELAKPAVTQEGMVNVNTAASAELMNLPGIGEKKAQAIIDYRNSKGPFHSLSDLGKVKGIGTKMLEKLKALVLF
nr:ComEA family DNA-binding protein [Paenibacillus monticola]